ncbi:tetratricopeptide repeat-containing sensor histidine kinase [Parapedobacter koreensis]|uniref:Tetratricopeptide repeat-containing protein n=1 Tax=Parapedobacter koreensis TaxID=332977 RepID=A0A1H7QYT0_9SPHI|nr:sensor histidine kinase [Parapedobacter koreensis]SEL52795.1 Tetratricopeptide repeat-containing protein [Parapedobacter koreensis]
MKQLSFLCFSLFMLTSAKCQVAHHDTARVYQLIETAREKQQQGLADAAEKDFRQAGTLAKQLNFDRGLLMYAGHYCVFLYHHVRYEEALSLAQVQLEVSQRLDDKQRMGYAFNNISLQYQAQGKLQQAAAFLMRALEISSEIKHPTLRDLSDRRKYYNNLSSLLLDMHDLGKGKEYAIKALEIAEQLQDTIAIGWSLVNLTVAEAMAGKLADAEKHGLELLAIGQSQRDIEMELKAHNNLGDIYRMQKRFALALETFKKSQRLLDKAPPGNEVYVLMGISSTYKDLGHYEAADTYFRRASVLAEEELAKPQLIELYRSGAEIKEGMGAYKEALALRKRYEQINDSVRNQEIHNTIQELEVKYQTSEKEKALAERDLKISEQRSEMARLNTWIMLSVSFVAILAMILVFSRLINQQKRKTEATVQANRLLEAQLQGEEKERARTARELHDGVASILSAAKLHIHARDDGERPHANILLGQLIETAVQEIRNISHNLAPEVVLDEGFAHAVQEYCRRVSHSGLRLECYIVGTLPKLDKNAELLLYRIIQEAVANLVKHAEATEGIVQLVGDGPRLSITVEDNGRGFDPANLTEKGIGLKNLISRVQLLQGSQEVRSAPGQGTSIYIEIDAAKAMQYAATGLDAQYSG